MKYSNKTIDLIATIIFYIVVIAICYSDSYILGCVMLSIFQILFMSYVYLEINDVTEKNNFYKRYIKVLKEDKNSLTNTNKTLENNYNFLLNMFKEHLKAIEESSIKDNKHYLINVKYINEIKEYLTKL